MFQKKIQPEDEIDPRYVTLGGYPRYVYKAGALKRMFDRARDFIVSKEVLLTTAFTISAGKLEGLTAGSLSMDTLIAAGFTATAVPMMKFTVSTVEMGMGIGYLADNLTIRKKPYYFDKEPEGLLNSEKPLSLYSDETLKSKARTIAGLTGFGAAAIGAAGVATGSLFVTGLASMYAVPLANYAYRYGKVALGQWDLTDAPPPQKKLPEKEKRTSARNAHAPNMP